MENLQIFKIKIKEKFSDCGFENVIAQFLNAREYLPEKCPVWVYLIVGLSLVGYLYLWNTWQYWKRRGINGPTPSLLKMGNTTEVFAKFGRKDDAFSKWSKEYGPMYGIFQVFTMPTLMINDPKMIREVSVKQFSRFTTRLRSRANFLLGPLSENFMTIIEGNAWRRQRSTIKPFFSGARLAEMTPILINAANKVSDDSISQVAKSGDTLDTRELAREFSMTAIMASGFSIDAAKNPGLMQEAIIHGNKLMGTNIGKAMLLMFIPQWIRFKFNITPYPRETDTFLRALVKDIFKNAVESRKQGQTIRPDFVSLMTENIITEAEAKIEARGFTETEITSQAILFILAGFDTTSNVLSAMLYVLAIYPVVQDELFENITSEITGEITYDKLKKLNFLDAIIKETQRVYPTAPMLSRECDETTTINGFPIEKGAVIAWSLQSLHNSEEGYDEPEKFNPHRFDGNESNTLQDENWMAYGSGPRACPAVRWTFVAMKIIIIQILLKYKIVKTDKTLNPGEWWFELAGSSLTSNKNLLIGFEER